MATNTTKKATTTMKATTTKKATAKKVYTPPMWINVKGIMNLFAREVTKHKQSFMSFSTSVGKKNDDDEYINVYYDVMFKKNEAPDVDEGRFQIKIKKGFLTVKQYSDGSLHHAVMVLEYDPIFDDEDEDDEDDEDEDEDDLPF